MNKSLLVLSSTLTTLALLVSPAQVHATTYPQLESVASDGTQQNNSLADEAHTISADGRYMAFISEATNLVPGDTNGQNDAFVHDRQTGITERVNIASDGTQADDDTQGVSISGDGRYVEIYSYATNLVPNDTNNAPDIFVHDRQTGATELVSIASDGTQANRGSVMEHDSISADGRYVIFGSDATNLVPNDTNNNPDIFLHDRQTGITERVSVASDGTEANDHSGYPATISANGRYVAFTSSASNLVAGDTNNTYDTFLHDRQTGITERVSVASDGVQGNDTSVPYSISNDGRYVSFHSSATNLVPNDTNDSGDSFVHDRQTGITERVSVASDGTQGDKTSGYPFLSADGRYVTFFSNATNLVAGDTNANNDIFVHDRQTGVTQRVSIAFDGAQSNNNSQDAQISADGHYISFNSNASNLVSNDTNNRSDIFITINPLSPPVNNSAPTVNSVTVTPSTANVNTSVSVSASFNDTDTANTHTATINWGDGSATQSGTVTESSGSGTVSGTHTYTATGSHTVTVTVTDSAGASATGTATATVIPATGLLLGNIQGADYSGANLSGQNMLLVNARGTNFTGANLSGATLTGANASGANFTNANLTNANLIGANLRNANFTGATLTGANLTGANVNGVIWSNTICPNGTNSNTHNNSCAGQGGGL